MDIHHKVFLVIELAVFLIIMFFTRRSRSLFKKDLSVMRDSFISVIDQMNYVTSENIVSFEEKISEAKAVFKELDERVITQDQK